MTDYQIHTDIAHGPLERIDVGALIAGCAEPWWNQTLCQVDDAVIRLGIICGEFHWHHHDAEDEFFYVISGTLLIDLEDPERTIELAPQQGFVVPKGVRHRTRAPERVVMLMVERAGVVPTGDGATSIRR